MNEIFKRASIRRFEDRAVEEEKITMILKAAMAAPSAGNQQPWEFFVVTDREKIKELSKCSPYSRCAAKAPVVLVPCMKTEGLRLPEMALVDLSEYAAGDHGTGAWRRLAWRGACRGAHEPCGIRSRHWRRAARICHDTRRLPCRRAPEGGAVFRGPHTSDLRSQAVSGQERY